MDKKASFKVQNLLYILIVSQLIKEVKCGYLFQDPYIYALSNYSSTDAFNMYTLTDLGLSSNTSCSIN